MLYLVSMVASVFQW